MDTFNKYPELVTIDKRPEILAVRQVIATEKLHGSNFRVHFPTGIKGPDELRFGSRNEVVTETDGFYGGRPIRWFRDNPALVSRVIEVLGSYGLSDVVLFGEVCGSSVQKGIKYAGDGEIIFRAFDIMVAGNFVTYDLFVSICDAAGLVRVPEIWRGEPSLEAFDALLEKPSEEAVRNGLKLDQNVSEGVVIRSNPLLRDVFGEWLIIKHKAQKYREATPPRARKPAEMTDTAAMDDFVATYVVQGRVINALGRLRDAGTALQGSMQDMPKLAEAIVVDLHKECEAEWQALVQKGYGDKQIRNSVTRTLANVYRDLLASGEA